MGSKKTIAIVVLSILLLISSIGFIVTLKNKNKVQIKTKVKEVYGEKQREEIEKTENIVFFGDSITELYPIEDIYGNLPVVRSGVSGFKTQDLLDRMDSMLYHYNPTKVILLIGINDFMPDKSEENQQYIIKNIKKIISEIKKHRPKAKVYLESIYPINYKMWKQSSEESDNETIKHLNEQLLEYAKKNDVVFINMFDELIDEEGKLNEKYTNDGLHPNTMGYAKITRVLVPYIYE